MSNWRYYKCRFPKQKRYASNGQVINFVDVGDDTGVGKTDNDWLAKEIDQMIAEQRGGIFKSDESEYDSLKKNPKPILSSPWREEIGKSGVEVNHRPMQHALRNLDDRAAEVEIPAPATPLTGPAATETPVRPTATKRK